MLLMISPPVVKVVTRLIHLLGKKILGNMQQGNGPLTGGCERELRRDSAFSLGRGAGGRKRKLERGGERHRDV